MSNETGGNGREGFYPAQPLLAWLSAVQEMSGAALGSVEQMTHLTQAQWRMVREAMALMTQLPLAAVEEGTRELARLRDAMRAVQLQMSLVDDQLAALEEMLKPVQEWARAWQDLTQT